MRLVLVLSILFLSTSCKDEWKESMAKSMADYGAPAIAKTFTCSNPDQIKKDLYGKLIASKLLKPNSTIQKGLGSSACNAVLDAVIPKLVDFGNNKLPVTWGCTSESIENIGKVLSKEICSRVTF